MFPCQVSVPRPMLCPINRCFPLLHCSPPQSCRGSASTCAALLPPAPLQLLLVRWRRSPLLLPSLLKVGMLAVHARQGAGGCNHSLPGQQLPGTLPGTGRTPCTAVWYPCTLLTPTTCPIPPSLQPAPCRPARPLWAGCRSSRPVALCLPPLRPLEAAWMP